MRPPLSPSTGCTRSLPNWLRISADLGGFVVEASAALIITCYVAWLWSQGGGRKNTTGPGIFYSVLTGLCVGAGTVGFFLLFQAGAPLSVVPSVLAAMSALTALAGFLLFKESFSWARVLGILLSLAGLFLLQQSPGK
jgi:bacterial/archaeal transporter family protein